MANIETTGNINNSTVDESSEEEEIDEPSDQGESDGPDESGVSEIFQRLSSAGAAIKRVPSSIVIQQKLQCVSCQKAFPNQNELHRHLIARHVQMPDLILEKIPSDDDATDEENEQDWSDEEQDVKVPIKPVSGMGALDKYLTGIPGIVIKKTSESVGSNLLIKSMASAHEEAYKLEDLKKAPNIVLKEISAPVQNSVSNLGRIDTPSPPQKIITPGALRMTIKHSGDRDNFQIIGSGNSVVKTETVAAVETDSKTGIVENFLATQIKVEPAAVTATQVRSESIKSEPDDSLADHIKVKSFANRQSELDVTIPKPIIVPKKEPDDKSAACVVIELNGDSDKDDDDDAVIFVPSSPPPDKKPILGFPSIPRKPHITEIDSTPPPVSSGSSIVPPPLTMLSGMVSSSPARTPVIPATTSCPPSQVSTAKQHNFSWNPSVSGVRDPFEASPADRSSDALLESLLAPSGQRNSTDLGPSEYISLDRLGPQHTCEVCKTRFTDLNLLDRHQKATGHSSQLVMTNMSGGAILPSYKTSDTSNFLNSLFPAKLAETVGKLAGTQPFTQQQNIMVNIQSFPGGMGQPGQPGQSNMPAGYGFPGAPTMQSPYPPHGYGQPAPGQYPPQYPQQQQPYSTDVYGQYQQQSQPGVYNRHPVPQPGYTPPGSYPNAGQYGYPMPSISKAGAYSGHAPVPNHMQLGSNPTSEAPNLPDPNRPASQTSPSSSGIRIQNLQQSIPGQKQSPGARAPGPASARGMARGGPRMVIRGRGAGPRGAAGVRPSTRPASQFQGQAIRGPRPGMIRTPVKRPGPVGNGASQSSPKRRPDMLFPDRHDNEDSHAVSMQRQRENLPLIQSIQGSKEKSVQLSDQITVTKTRVRPPTPPPVAKDAGAVANMLAMRGIKITQKPKSPSPPPVIIPNLGSGISITKSSGTPLTNFSIAGDHDVSCTLCPKTFSNSSALSVHMSQMHPSAPKMMIRCDSCPASYATASHLQEHKRVFHNQGATAEMGIPVVDLSQQSNIRKLSNLGIINFIPLANREQGGGCFGIPVVSATNSMNGSLNGCLQALGAAGVLSLGPLKPLPKC